MMFCRHEWIEVARTVAKPYLDELLKNTKRLSGANASALLSEAATGSTTIVWECNKCHKLRKVKMMGLPQNRRIPMQNEYD